VNKILLFILISFFLVNCSLNKNSRLWNEKEKDLNENKNLTKIFVEEKKESSELNPLIKLDLSKNQQNNKTVDNLNNFGSLKYNGSLNKIANFKFAKFNNFSQFDFEPLILKDGLIFFDKKGNILRFNDNQKIVWKKNYYSKTEKKLNPKLLFSMKDKNLIVADNIAKIFLINSISGDLIWSKKSDYPFNSQIKIYKDRFFVVDYKNILRCFYLKDGSECWNVQTEDSFTISNSKYSLIIVNDLVIFNNSVGDITAVNILSGLIKWQLPTQKSSIINETYNFNYSRLVSDGNSIYFSNNKNQFFSVDLNTGTTNWINEVSSILTPVIIDNYIFTVSEDGYLFTIQKKQGNIIRINDLYKNYDLKKRKKLKPIGFLVGQNNLYLTNSDGSLIVVKLISGNILKIEKVSRDLISKPYIYNGELFIVKNGSIVKYD
jgi:outer membrane protein assembly factor BamB